MLALYFDGNLELKELPRPQPGAGEVLIRVHLAGVCRTDLEVLRGYHAFRGVPGHEFLGTVAGPHDSPWLERRGVGEINVSCLECDRCRGGLTNHCRRRLVLGLNGRDGAFAQYVTLPERNLHPVPPEVPDEVAVFTEPLAAALRVLEAAPPMAPQTRVLVVGDGSLGLQASWVLARHGAAGHLAGHHPEHLRLAEPHGVSPFLEKELPPGGYGGGGGARGGPGG